MPRASRPPAALVLLGAAGTGIAFLWFYTLISEIGPARASVIAYIAPGFSVVYGVVLLDEAFSVAAVAGLALILAGSWLAVGGRAKREREAGDGARGGGRVRAGRGGAGGAVLRRRWRAEPWRPTSAGCTCRW